MASVCCYGKQTGRFFVWRFGNNGRRLQPNIALATSEASHDITYRTLPYIIPQRMARLNEPPVVPPPPPSSEQYDAIKRKFIRTNRELAKYDRHEHILDALF